jgi:predicted nucleic acid-binding protein
MTGALPPGVVVDTNVMSWLLDERPNTLADRYRALIGQRSVVLSFQSVMEMRYGAFRANWGELRRWRLERRLTALVVVQPDEPYVDDLRRASSTLRAVRLAPGRLRPFRQTTILDVELHDWLEALADVLDKRIPRAKDGRPVSMNHVLRAALREARDNPDHVAAIEHRIRAEREAQGQ